MCRARGAQRPGLRFHRPGGGRCRERHWFPSRDGTWTGLQYELERLLGSSVDVVTERGLKARIRDRVLREAVPLGETPRNGCATCWRPLRPSSAISTAARPPSNRTSCCKVGWSGTCKSSPRRRELCLKMVRALAPEIEWPKIVGMRNVMVHEYFDIDAEVVWEAASRDAPTQAAQREASAASGGTEMSPVRTAREQLAQAAKLDTAIAANLKEFEHGG